jgi:hypothetical protein
MKQTLLCLGKEKRIILNYNISIRPILAVTILI